MRITDNELNILKILDIIKGTIEISKVKCRNRHSDCLVFVLSGRADYKFNNKIYTAEKGDIIFLAHNSNYDIEVSFKDYNFIYFDFFFERQNNEALENEIFKGFVFSSLENTFIKLKRIWEQGSFADKINCKSIIYKIYYEIVKERLYSYVPSVKRGLIEKAINEMTENYTNPYLSVENLSKICGISEVHFRRLFSKIYHTSPMKFIIRMRIARAKEMLANSDFKISLISEECGFNTPYYFSKVFRENTGMTPMEYRKLSKSLY